MRLNSVSQCCSRVSPTILVDSGPSCPSALDRVVAVLDLEFVLVLERLLGEALFQRRAQSPPFKSSRSRSTVLTASVMASFCALLSGIELAPSALEISAPFWRPTRCRSDTSVALRQFAAAARVAAWPAPAHSPARRVPFQQGHRAPQSLPACVLLVSAGIDLGLASSWISASLPAVRLVCSSLVNCLVLASSTALRLSCSASSSLSCSCCSKSAVAHLLQDVRIASFVNLEGLAAVRADDLVHVGATPG
jgi:hypothetical protein